MRYRLKFPVEKRTEQAMKDVTYLTKIHKGTKLDLTLCLSLFLKSLVISRKMYFLELRINFDPKEISTF